MKWRAINQIRNVQIRICTIFQKEANSFDIIVFFCLIQVGGGITVQIQDRFVDIGYISDYSPSNGTIKNLAFKHCQQFRVSLAIWFGGIC